MAPAEDFSETLAAYFIARDTPQLAELRRLMPERFKIVDGLLDSWRNEQSAAAARPGPPPSR